MNWRYCVTRETTPDGHWFTIREVYTNDNGELSWTEDEIAAGGETLEETGHALNLMREALNQPILDITANPPRYI